MKIWNKWKKDQKQQYIKELEEKIDMLGHKGIIHLILNHIQQTQYLKLDE